MTAQLQARGAGLCPVNVEGCTTDSFVGFLEREGYTDIKVVTVGEVRDDRSAPRRTPSKGRRTVTRRPRA